LHSFAFRNILYNAFKKDRLTLGIADSFQIQIGEEFAAVLAPITVKVMSNIVRSQLLGDYSVTVFRADINLFGDIMDFTDYGFGRIVTECLA
jgi:hypothetical protein